MSVARDSRGVNESRLEFKLVEILFRTNQVLGNSLTEATSGTSTTYTYLTSSSCRLRKYTFLGREEYVTGYKCQDKNVFDRNEQLPDESSYRILWWL